MKGTKRPAGSQPGVDSAANEAQHEARRTRRGLPATLRDTLARSRTAWHIVPWQTRALLAWMETHEGGCLGVDQVARSWVWADLHLNHQAIIWSGQRPFRDATAMRTALLTAWNEMIREDELIVCLGDVTVGPPSSVIDEALAALPGTKLLVVRNHEFVNNRELPKDLGFEAIYSTLVCESDRRCC